ncbi:uncharacterized protein LOC106181954 [Lingula anatina]|uniref:Uncharacterized protein LOC106181954 n=1 Tax=Lingula anatina TaxID=7574 RepID=A0A1S3KHJ6_LINAN|nr:uncharacterized protein LOC106181954 [Lingula anatina]|eukprot:XP_013421977.1 uncharacterized protein LOC106181954 [Lingula anatina]
MTICLSPSSEPCILCSDQPEGNCWLCSGTDGCYTSAGWQCTPCETGSKSEEGTPYTWLKKGVAAFLFLAGFLVSVATLIVVLWKRHGSMSQLRASRLLGDVLHTEVALLETNGDCPHPHQTHDNQSNVLSSGTCNCDQARLTVTLCSKGWQIRADIGNENKIGACGRRGEGVLSECQCVQGCGVQGVHERQTDEDGRPSVGTPVGEMATTETETHFSDRHNSTAGEIVLPLLLPTSKSNKGTFNVSLVATTDNVIIKENGFSRSSHGFKEVQSEPIDGPVLERIFFTSGL